MNRTNLNVSFRNEKNDFRDIRRIILGILGKSSVRVQSWMGGGRKGQKERIKEGGGVKREG